MPRRRAPCAPGRGRPEMTDPLRQSVFVSARDLAAELAGPRPPVLLDLRFRTEDHDRRHSYLAGHIPGAVYVDLQRELAGEPGGFRGYRPLPRIADLQRAARLWGLSDGSEVVVYDDDTGLQAGRAWWVLRWGGMKSVRLLDGGYDAWLRAGLPVTQEVPAPVPGNVTLTPGNLPQFGAERAPWYVRNGVLLDSRGPDNYRGGPTAPGEPRRGHIPGAASAPTYENLDAQGMLRPAAELQARFEALGAAGSQPVGVYCGGGVSAAHQIAVLASLRLPAALFPGSWSAWQSDPLRPVARGPRPWGGSEGEPE